MILALSEWRGWDSTFVQLVDRDTAGIVAALVGVAIAVGAGALHALGPGHGKAMMAVYLGGVGARPRHALAVGGAVALMHTGSVLVVGWVLHVTRSLPLGDRLGPAVSLVVAIGVTAVGASLLWRHRHALPRFRRRADSDDPVPAADHHHGLPEGTSPVSRTGLVVLATSGGLLPSPSAFLLLVTALATGRTAYGLLLVASFGVGMAVTLTGAGMAALAGSSLLSSRAARHRGVRRLLARMPVIAAAGVIVGGALMGTDAMLKLFSSTF